MSDDTHLLSVVYPDGHFRENDLGLNRIIIVRKLRVVPGTWFLSSHLRFLILFRGSELLYCSSGHIIKASGPSTLMLFILNRSLSAFLVPKVFLYCFLLFYDWISGNMVVLLIVWDFPGSDFKIYFLSSRFFSSPAPWTTAWTLLSVRVWHKNERYITDYGNIRLHWWHTSCKNCQLSFLWPWK